MTATPTATITLPDVSASAAPDDVTFSVTQPSDETTPGVTESVDGAESPVAPEGSLEAAGVKNAGSLTGDSADAAAPVIPSGKAQRQLPRSSPPQQPVIRPRGLARAAVPGHVPSPEHHHLPGWVRRTYGQARPILADLLGILDGDARVSFQTSVNDLTAGVSSGKFSLAWQYPELINEGMALYEKHRQQNVETTLARRNVETARRKVADTIRDATLTPDVQARLTKALRSATDADAIRGVAADVGQAAGVARSSHDKRRDREIERTRARIKAGAPRAAQGPTESWQDVLRRFADSQESESP